MRRLILLGLAAAMVLPACAARRVTVAQLEKALVAATAEHRADADIVRLIGNMELSERLTDASVERLAAKLPLNSRTTVAVQLLADQSAFLDPPAKDLPATAFPDASTQQRLVEAARGYVLQTVPRLPDFFATRTTLRFDDSPQVLAEYGWPVRAGLHQVGSTDRRIAFRDGKEVLDPVAATGAGPSPKKPDEIGLHTWGEFGPVLAVVLNDVAKGSVTWSYWEQTPSGLAAVFHYSVPRAASHYVVNYCCRRDNQFVQRRPFTYGSRSRNAEQGNSLNPTGSAETFTETPGYHGSLSIDPATGAVLRITLEAELKSGDPLLRAAVVVQYGTVTIGGRSYICPIRSLAFSMEADTGGPLAGTDATWGGPITRSGPIPTLLLNETSFTQYHRLGSTMRILTDSAPTSTRTNSAASDETAGTGADGIAAPVPLPSSSTSAETSELARQGAANIPSAVSAPEPAVAAAPPASPEISMAATNSVPDEPAIAAQLRDTGYSLKLTSRLVDVGIVAYDKKGRAVTDLNAENFEIYDNGHKQEVRFFSQAASAMQAAQSEPASGADGHTFSNRSHDHDNAVAAVPTLEAGATILLIDESHIAWNDMNNARNEMLKFLGTLAPAERIGLYSMSSLGFRVLVESTTDHAALIARLKTFTPKAQSLLQAQEEEKRNRQQINEVRNVSDLNSVNGNHSEVPDAEQPVDPQLMTMGSNPTRASLIILAGVARHLAAVPGHKNVVWVSSDNVFADWQDQAVGIDKSANKIDSYAMRAQEAMNDAHAAVYPFDVSELEGGAIDADMQHRNVELTQAASDNAGAGGPAQGSAGRNMDAGRITAQMKQDLRPIQGSIREVAAATGGRAVRRSGDLASALSGIVDDGHGTFQLSFSPQGQADDQYHTISVKLTGRRGLTLRYRTGYVFAKEPATLKDRFQQAVWRPLDVSEIAITAEIARLSSNASVKVNIAAGDLGMQQQAERWMDKLDIFYIQRDDAGVHANLEGQTLGLRLKSSTYQNLLREGVPFEREVVMHPGMASLRILVVDENSGRMGSVTIPALELGKPH